MVFLPFVIDIYRPGVEFISTDVKYEIDDNCILSAAMIMADTLFVRTWFGDVLVRKWL